MYSYNAMMYEQIQWIYIQYSADNIKHVECSRYVVCVHTCNVNCKSDVPCNILNLTSLECNLQRLQSH